MTKETTIETIEQQIQIANTKLTQITKHIESDPNQDHPSCEKTEYYWQGVLATWQIALNLVKNLD